MQKCFYEMLIENKFFQHRRIAEKKSETDHSTVKGTKQFLIIFIQLFQVKTRITLSDAPSNVKRRQFRKDKRTGKRLL